MLVELSVDGDSAAGGSVELDWQDSVFDSFDGAQGAVLDAEVAFVAAKADAVMYGEWLLAGGGGNLLATAELVGLVAEVADGGVESTHFAVGGRGDGALAFRAVHDFHGQMINRQRRQSIERNQTGRPLRPGKLADNGRGALFLPVLRRAATYKCLSPSLPCLLLAVWSRQEMRRTAQTRLGGRAAGGSFRNRPPRSTW
jgi:hypothetical protein